MDAAWPSRASPVRDRARWKYLSRTYGTFPSAICVPGPECLSDSLCACGNLLKATLLECSYIFWSKREPFSALSLVIKPAMPILLDSFWIIGFNDMNRVGLLR